jgi:hypothetical protein
MKTDNDPHRLDLSRRRLLRSATLAAAAGAFAAVTATGSTAFADTKFSQAMAKYQATPKGAARCDNCSQFSAPSSCKVVASPVAAAGWCALYAAKS